MSRTGLALGLGYAVIAVWCIAFALSSGDAKGQFVLLRAPIALQGAFVEASVWWAPFSKACLGLLRTRC